MCKFNSIYLLIITVSFLSSCGKGGLKKGSELKGNEATEYLAGESKKTWMLDSGHDYYEYLEFDNKGEVMFQSGLTIKYTADGSNLTMIDFQPFVYTLVEVSDNKFSMYMPNHDTLVYVKSSEKLKKDKTVGAAINPKWLKGKYGTSWKFVDGDKIYSFMNDGRVLDANTLVKVDNWSIKGNTLNFGPTKLPIFRLSPVFFDYDVFGMTVKLNYVSEASKDGSPARK
jgi:hypothetical protein